MSVNVVGEIGCHHLGSMELAKKHIDIFFAVANLKYVKFQKRTNSILLTPDEQNRPHPVPEFAYGNTYLAHREALELNINQHKELFEYCQGKKINYSCSAWDVNAAKELVSVIPEIEYIKIPSAANLNFKLMDYIFNYSNCNLHISTGMTSKKEIDQILNFIASKNQEKRTVIYACTSGYPVDFEDVCLLEISRLKELCGKQFLGIGYSSHERGLAVCLAAVVLGATWIEKHIVLDRTIKHTDAAGAIESDGIRRLIRDIEAIEKSLTYKPEEILEVEKEQRKKLKRNA